jgi:hypothetical protein
VSCTFAMRLCPRSPVDAGYQDMAVNPAAYMLHASDVYNIQANHTGWLAASSDTENGLRNSASWYCRYAFVEMSISVRWYALDICIQQGLFFR